MTNGNMHHNLGNDMMWLLDLWLHIIVSIHSWNCTPKYSTILRGYEDLNHHENWQIDPAYSEYIPRCLPLSHWILENINNITVSHEILWVNPWL